MLIIALVLAVIGLAALVTAVVTSNELIAWVCIGASVIGVLLLIVDALRERSRGAEAGTAADLQGADEAVGTGDAVGDEAGVVEEYPATADSAEAEAEAESASAGEDSEGVEPAAESAAGADPDSEDADEPEADSDGGTSESVEGESEEAEDADAESESGFAASQQATAEANAQNDPQPAVRGLLGRFGRRR